MRRLVLPLVLFASLQSFAALAATPEQLTAFFRAVQLNDTKTVQQLVGKTVNPNEINPLGGEPALVLAVREGSMGVFQALLQHPGTDLEAKAMNGNTALMMAAYKRNKPAAEALLARGARVNQAGWTPLHYAAASGDEDIARLLIAKEARLDAVSPKESGAYTPLMMAAREGQQGMARLLLEQGADPRLKDSEGLTAVQIAERAGRSDIVTTLSGARR
ncbi:ankyrin repeat domain-containing protein [Massilia sp. G4R7]|uniref:Ankyrin repeat domain-containing protein n=1 Tax=Massilia phyllostachyos TaxID=2898585 RepID=A0ABS8Q6V3_9BURK|nr:ankyrin repeat domain-containing protein [Massilia phyllostachyos]MCD2516691.1 ankyrin repeat domain-containing protein [Massilia phyllostachyos]